MGEGRRDINTSAWPMGSFTCRSAAVVVATHPTPQLWEGRTGVREWGPCVTMSVCQLFYSLQSTVRMHILVVTIPTFLEVGKDTLESPGGSF